MPTNKKKKKGRGAKARRGQKQGVTNGPAAPTANELTKNELDEEAIDAAVTEALRSLPEDAKAPDGTSCWICLEEGPDDSCGGELLRDCSCRGDSSGWVHFGCIFEYASRKEHETQRKEKDKFLYHHNTWELCPNCNQMYMGRLALNLAQSFTKLPIHPDLLQVVLVGDGLGGRLRHLMGIKFLAATLARNLKWKVALDFIIKINTLIKSMKAEFDADLPFSEIIQNIEAEVLLDMGTYELYGEFNHARKGNIDRAFANLQSSKNFFESKGSLERAKAVEDTILEMKHRFGLLYEDEDFETTKVELAREQFERAKKTAGNGSGLSVTKCSNLIEALVEERRLIEAYHLLCDMLPLTRRTFGTDHTLTKKVMEPHLHGAIFERRVLHKDDWNQIAELLYYDESTDMYSVLSGEKFENGEHRRNQYFAKPRDLTFFLGALVEIEGAESEKSRFNGMRGIVQDFSRPPDQVYEGEEHDKCPRYNIGFVEEGEKIVTEYFHWDDVRVVFFDVP